MTTDSDSTLRITSVNYGRLVSLGNYENERVGASARVEEGEDPDEVLANLKRWVSERLTDIYANRQDETRAWELRNQIGAVERQLREAREKWASAKAVLEKHGVEIPADDLESLPF